GRRRCVQRRRAPPRRLRRLPARRAAGRAGAADRADPPRDGRHRASSDDPVRVHERFATLDALAPGRAEMTVGRGSFTESFPLYGLDLADYEVLFSEKLDLLVALRSDEPVSWSGTIRPPLQAALTHPRPEHGPIPIWVGVGGSPESVVRAARYGLPMQLAIIGGSPQRFAPFAELYRRALAELGKP